MRYVLALVILLVHAPSGVAQSRAVRGDLARPLEQVGLDARNVRTAPVVRVPADADLQAAIDAAEPNTTLELAPGAVYRSAVVRKRTTRLTLTTARFAIGDRAALPSDAPAMAAIQGSAGKGYGLWIQGSQITVRGVRFMHNLPRGQGEMLRIGDATNPNLADVPDEVTVQQLLMQGNAGNEFGQKRAIAANGTRLLIDQSYVEDVWVPGQDSQCVAVFSTPGPITIRRNIMACASENILIGGTPPAGPAFVPSDIIVEGNVLWKPLKWKGASPARVVKNLFEVKVGRRISVRGNWMQTHWRQAQPGPAIVLTMATSGACSYCDMQDVTFADNVVWDVSAGLSLTGWQYSHAPGAGQAVRFVIENNLFVISREHWSGNGRPLVLGNEPKDVVVDHNTFIHDGTAVVAGAYGSKWPLVDPPLAAKIAGGPVTGFVFTNNLTTHGKYGFFTPEGNRGVALGTYFPGAVIAGNVFAGAPASVLGRYNAFAGGKPNVGAADFAALFVDYAAQNYCPVKPDAGADCAKLPFALRALVPAQ